MDIIIKNTSCTKLNNTEVRWYISSQEVWIGGVQTYYEIEDMISETFGSFEWLYSGSDTILFDKENLMFKVGILDVSEPIIIRDTILDNNVLYYDKFIQLRDKGNCNCKLSNKSIYFSENDILVSLSCEEDYINTGNIKEYYMLTEDFGFQVFNGRLIGWIMKNASVHLATDDTHYLDHIIDNIFLKFLLCDYLHNILKLDEDLSDTQNRELINNFKKILEQCKPSKDNGVKAIKNAVIQVLDFM